MKKLFTKNLSSNFQEQIVNDVENFKKERKWSIEYINILNEGIEQECNNVKFSYKKTMQFDAILKELKFAIGNDLELIFQKSLKHTLSSLIRGGQGRNVELSYINIHSFGSYQYGAAVENSDMDLSLEGVLLMDPKQNGHEKSSKLRIQFNQLSHNDQLSMLKAIQSSAISHFRKRSIPFDMQNHMNARIPVLVITDPSSGVSLDLSIGNASGLATSNLLKYLMRTYPSLRRLIYLVKVWAQVGDLNTSYRGTLRSYAWVLMAAWGESFGNGRKWSQIFADLGIVQIDLQDPDTVSRFMQQDWFKPQNQQEADTKLELNKSLMGNEGDKESLLEKFGRFLAAGESLMRIWLDDKNLEYRASVWDGTIKKKGWQNQYVIGLEDPFDQNNNSGRSLGIQENFRSREVVQRVHQHFKNTLDVIKNLQSLDDVVKAAKLMGLSKHQLQAIEDRIKSGQQLKPDNDEQQNKS